MLRGLSERFANWRGRGSGQEPTTTLTPTATPEHISKPSLESPVDQTPETVDADRDFALVQQYVSELSQGALEVGKDSTIDNDDDEGGSIPLKVTVLNIYGFSRIILVTFSIASRLRTDGAVPKGVLFPVTKEKIAAILSEKSERQREITDWYRAESQKKQKTV